MGEDHQALMATYARAIRERIQWDEDVVTIGGRDYPLTAVIGRVLDAAHGIGILVTAGVTRAATLPEVHAAAQRLAEASGSPRYGELGLGWRAVLASEQNMEHAAAHAQRRALGAQAAEAVAADQAILRAHLRSSGAHRA